jgi:hypothetical protein
VAVQELSWDMAGPLADALREAYPYQTLAPSAAPDGLGIFSRLPFEDVVPADIGPPPGPCYCQAVSVRLGGRAVQVLNAHPGPPDVGVRRLGPLPLPVHFDDGTGLPDRRQLLQRLDAAHLPLLLLGDLNTAERQPYYAQLRQRLADTHREVGWGPGWTFPSPPVGPLPVPLVRIDYVLHSSEWRAAAEHTGLTPGSDHRHVVADLVLQSQ